jgi:hypothetical protein
LEAESAPAKVRLEGLDKLKKSITSLGIETVTNRLAAYCPNQLRPQKKMTG